MGSTQALSVMKRKAGAGRGGLAAAATSTARAWYTTMPRVADDDLGLELSVQSVQDMSGPAEALLGDLVDGTLLLLMRDGGGRTGVCALDPGFLAAVIEMHMTGAVAAVAPPVRRPTPTDAAIVSGLVDAICAAFDAALGDMSVSSPFHGARCGGYLPDTRAAVMSLPEGALHRVRVVTQLGGRARQGQIVLVMPAVAGLSDAGAGQGRPLGEDLGRAIMGGQVVIDAVLHRIRLPLAQVRGLRVGDTLPVPATALGSVSVEARDGRRVARARLGQVDGLKALRLVLDPDREADGAARLGRPDAVADLPRAAGGQGGGPQGADARTGFNADVAGMHPAIETAGPEPAGSAADPAALSQR
jgi:flagellar motor switch protein FliM